MIILTKNTNNSRFEDYKEKLKQMIRAKFGSPENEMIRIAHHAKNDERARQRMAEIMELWRFDSETFSKLEKIWDDIVGTKYQQLEFNDEI